MESNSIRASVILPAHNEAAFLGSCLTALFASQLGAISGRVEVIVVANGCTDETAGIARGCESDARAAGWKMQVIEVAEGGKLNALNVGDAAALGPIRIYLDADVVVGHGLVKALVEVLAGSGARYASGQPQVSLAKSRVTRGYARFWQGLPFLREGVPGFGVFAVNAEGRARWATFPDVISDDTFVRLSFAPDERFLVAPNYQWPMVEGFANLVRVRRRQDRGVQEITELYPELGRNDDERAKPDLLRLMLRDPIGFCIYAAVSLAVKLPILRSGGRWARGR